MLRVLLLAFLAPAAGWAAEACPAIPPRTPMPQEAVAQPIPQQPWLDGVHALDARLLGAPLATTRLVFIGDSITAGWDPGIFRQFYAARAPLLLGVIGDYTQGLLNRLPLEWGPLHPRLAVLLIGTNNTQWGGGTADNVALGIAENIRLIHARSPGTRILVIGILPHGATRDDPVRQTNDRINRLIAGCADNRSVFFNDPGWALTDQAGNLSAEVSFDLTHLTPVGYALLAMALEPDIKRIMGE